MSRNYPVVARDLWSEVLPGLWIGGTADHDTGATLHRPMITKAEFDTVITLYAWANPVDWFVREVRFGFYDAEVNDSDIDALVNVVEMAHQDWKSGKRVLIRCQAGLNRSGLVTALILLREGYSGDEAIHLLREKRCIDVLCNTHFEKFILETDPTTWRAQLSVV